LTHIEGRHRHIFPKVFWHQSHSRRQMKVSGTSHTVARTARLPSRLGHGPSALANGEDAATAPPTTGPRSVSQSQPKRFLQRACHLTTIGPYHPMPLRHDGFPSSSRFRRRSDTQKWAQGVATGGSNTRMERVVSLHEAATLGPQVH
jgi:hypothetical protein